MALGGVSLPPTPALRNSVKCSSTGKFISILCDFGTVQILRLKGEALQILNRDGIAVDHASEIFYSRRYLHDEQFQW